MLVSWSGAYSTDLYPTRTIRIVVPASPGNGLDIIARRFADQFEKVIGGSVVIENKPGAGQIIGAAHVARSTPNGYTLLFGASALITSYVTHRNVPYKLEDLVAVAGIADSPLALVASARYRTFDDFLLNARRFEFTYGAPGYGSSSHLAGVRFSHTHELKTRMIPYRGSPDALADVMMERINFYFVPPIAVKNQEKLKVFHEVYYPNWSGLFVPLGTPPGIIWRIDNAAREVIQSPQFREWLGAAGSLPLDLTPTQFREFLQFELKTYQILVEMTGIRQ